MIDAGPFVAHPETDRGRYFLGAHLDRRAIAAEFHGVGDQVEEDLPELATVGEDRRRAGEPGADFDALALGLRSDERDGVLDHALGRDRLELQLEPAGFDLRQIEDVVDQREQVPAARQHVLDEFGVLRRECLPAFFEEQLGKADDRVQWCAQLVRHVGKELRLEPVSLLDLDVLRLQIDPLRLQFLGLELQLLIASRQPFGELARLLMQVVTDDGHGERQRQVREELDGALFEQVLRSRDDQSNPALADHQRHERDRARPPSREDGHESPLHILRDRIEDHGPA